MPNEKSPFVIDTNGVKYVEYRCFIPSPIILSTDGLKYTKFKGDKGVYIRLDDAIAWVEEEMKHHSRSTYSQILAAFRKFKNNEGELAPV